MADSDQVNSSGLQAIVTVLQNIAQAINLVVQNLNASLAATN